MLTALRRICRHAGHDTRLPRPWQYTLRSSLRRASTLATAEDDDATLPRRRGRPRKSTPSSLPSALAQPAQSKPTPPASTTPARKPRTLQSRNPNIPLHHLPPLVPVAPAAAGKHHDLASFLAYARATSLSERSTVFIGTHYEYTVLHALARRSLGNFLLTRVGGAADLGIDLLGSWEVPLHSPSPAPLPSRSGATARTASAPEQGDAVAGRGSVNAADGDVEARAGDYARPRQTPACRRLRVLLQCKAEAPRPSHVRELEGAVLGAPHAWREAITATATVTTAAAATCTRTTTAGAGTAFADAATLTGGACIAFLAAKGDATKGVREALGRSRLAMGFVGVTVEGRVRQLLWNRKAAEEMPGLGVGVRFAEGGEEEVVLTLDATVWRHDNVE